MWLRDIHTLLIVAAFSAACFIDEEITREVACEEMRRHYTPFEIANINHVRYLIGKIKPGQVKVK